MALITLFPQIARRSTDGTLISSAIALAGGQRFQLQLNPIVADYDQPDTDIDVIIELLNNTVWEHWFSANFRGSARAKDGSLPSMRLALPLAFPTISVRVSLKLNHLRVTRIGINAEVL